MLRHPLNEFSLRGAGKVCGPNPSFQPSLEVLEERIVLNSGTLSSTGGFVPGLGLVLAAVARRRARQQLTLLNEQGALAVAARVHQDNHNLEGLLSVRDNLERLNVREKKFERTIMTLERLSRLARSLNSDFSRVLSTFLERHHRFAVINNQICQILEQEGVACPPLPRSF